MGWDTRRTAGLSLACSGRPLNIPGGEGRRQKTGQRRERGGGEEGGKGEDRRRKESGTGLRRKDGGASQTAPDTRTERGRVNAREKARKKTRTEQGRGWDGKGRTREDTEDKCQAGIRQAETRRRSVTGADCYRHSASPHSIWAHLSAISAPFTR